MKNAVAIALLMLSATPAVADDTITVEEVASGQFELTLISNSMLEISSAQALLIPTAQALCPDKYPEFGHYEFESTESTEQRPDSDDPANFKIVQQVLCVETVPSREAGDRESFISGPKEERALVARIRFLSESYFADIFGSNYEKAYALLSAEMQSYRSFDEWTALMDQIRAKSGSVSALNVHTITIYDNPPNAPEPGLYVAADYQNSFEKAPYHCGYLLWFRGQSGEFRITREESGLVTYEILQQIPKENQANLLDQMRCTARQ